MNEPNSKNLLSAFRMRRNERPALSSIEVAILFGVLAVGFALVATPMLDKTSKRFAKYDAFFGEQTDNIVTGSMSKPRRYVISKSVLLPSKTSQCITYSNGKKYGDC
jgi:hypothetical protein